MRVNLTVDIGNSRTKAAIFNEGNLSEVLEFGGQSEVELFKWTDNFEIEYVIISSVAELPNWVNQLIGIHPSIILSSNTLLPYSNQYKSPRTLGADRLALVAGAQKNCPGKTSITIDIGTCITYDILEDGTKFIGGLISPGLEMRFDALNVLTAKLPRIDAKEDPQLVGDDTESSIRSGVMNGIVAEIEGIIQRIGKRYKNADVIMTGGSAEVFAGLIKMEILVLPKLLLIGLNEILEFNLNAKK